MTSIRRDHLVDTALNLFSRYGFHATGIDRILSESGVAKMTLYKHFKSKDELILAALRRRDELHRNWLMREVERLASTPRDRLVALFIALEGWFQSDEFTGCCFINAAAEYGDKDNPIHAAAAEHKRLIRAYILELAEAAEVKDPDGLADQLMLLMEGAIVSAQVTGDAAPARQARSAAEILVGRAASAESIAA
jgi:AcrR family transcriptional regulator